MSQQLLNPPKPPTIHEDGSASLVDGIQDITLADFTSAEIEDIAYSLSNKIGATR